MAEARSERNNVLLSRGLVYFLALHLLGLPRRPMFQPSVEHQQLVHTGRQGDFFDLPRRAAARQNFDRRLSRVATRCPVNTVRPCARPPTSSINRRGRSLRRHANSGRDVLPCSVPNSGSSRSNMRAHTGYMPVALGNRSSFSATGVARSVVSRSLSSTGWPLEPRHRATIALSGARSSRQAVLLRGPHADQWLAAPHKARRSCICRAAAGATGGSRRHRGPGAGIHRLRCRQRPWPGTIASLRVHDDHGEACRQQALVTALQAPGGFSTIRGGGGLPRPRASPPRWHRLRRPSVQRGAGPSLGFGHIKPDQTGHVPPTHSCAPDLAHTGSRAQTTVRALGVRT
jgi:hypothetical protein